MCVCVCACVCDYSMCMHKCRGKSPLTNAVAWLPIATSTHLHAKQSSATQQKAICRATRKHLRAPQHQERTCENNIKKMRMDQNL